MTKEIVVENISSTKDLLIFYMVLETGNAEALADEAAEKLTRWVLLLKLVIC